MHQTEIQTVEPLIFSFGSSGSGVLLDSGIDFGPIDIVYETYGDLNKKKSNAVLVFHAFTGSAHAAGYHGERGRAPGWWHHMIGPGKAIDTNKFFVICPNVFGSCYGSTGPSSINPETGSAYALDFPVITVHDMVKVQRRLIDHLEIQSLHAVIGGSMGGMQALTWSITYPEMVKSAIILASTARSTTQSIAFNSVGRSAIMNDAGWQSGYYYDKEDQPLRGLSVARMIGHITYLSDESMRMKFGRRLQESTGFRFDFAEQFAVESYLSYQGDKFVNRFDANSYIYLTKAMDYFDLTEQYGSLEAAFQAATARYLVLSFTSDWLYPPAQSKEMVFAMMRNDVDVSYTNLDSPYGHDAFLLENERQTAIISSFLGEIR
ncbi:homoserine O-acetyltransferase MetX [Spirochaeta dissipatitropha]